MSGPIPNCQSLKISICFASSGAFVEESADLDLAKQVSKWWALESYASFVSVDPRSRVIRKRSKLNKKLVSSLESASVLAYCAILMQNRWPTVFLAKSQLLLLERRLCMYVSLDIP